MKFSWLCALVTACQVLGTTAFPQPVDVTQCIGEQPQLSLSCPDGYNVTFRTFEIGGPGTRHGSQCVPLATDCSHTPADPRLHSQIEDCSWKKTNCSLIPEPPIRGTCTESAYLRAVDFLCVSNADHVSVTADTDTLIVPRNGRIHVTNEGHPNSINKISRSLPVESPSGVMIYSQYQLDLPVSCDQGSLVIRTKTEIFGPFCGSDTIKTPCLTDVSLEVTTPQSESYSGYAVVIEYCKSPGARCENSKWTKVCKRSDHVVAARVYSGGPGVRNGSLCLAASSDFRRTIPNASQCLWSESECTFDVAKVDGDRCNITYIRAVGETSCVPRSSVYVMKEATFHQVVEIKDNSSRYVITPGHPGPFPENKNFSIIFKASSSRVIHMRLLYPVSLSPKVNSKCPPSNSLRVEVRWSKSKSTWTEYVICGSNDHFELRTVGAEVRLHFNTGMNPGSNEGVALLVESWLIGSPTSAGPTTAALDNAEGITSSTSADLTTATPEGIGLPTSTDTTTRAHVPGADHIQGTSATTSPGTTSTTTTVDLPDDNTADVSGSGEKTAQLDLMHILVIIIVVLIGGIFVTLVVLLVCCRRSSSCSSFLSRKSERRHRECPTRQQGKDLSSQGTDNFSLKPISKTHSDSTKGEVDPVAAAMCEGPQDDLQKSENNFEVKPEQRDLDTGTFSETQEKKDVINGTKNDFLENKGNVGSSSSNKDLPNSGDITEPKPTVGSASDFFCTSSESQSSELEKEKELTVSFQTKVYFN